MESFAERSYSVSIASQLYSDDDHRNIPSTSFHFGYSLTLFFKEMFEMICSCCPGDWPRNDYYAKCIEEVD